MCYNKRKDGFVIHTITNEMEKAMHQTHGFGYAEYNRSLEKRMKVEASRERDYKLSCQLAAEFHKL